MKGYAPVWCSVTIMYATSSTKDSSSLAEVYFVASLQKLPSGFSLAVNVSNNKDYEPSLITFALNQISPIAKTGSAADS